MGLAFAETKIFMFCFDFKDLDVQMQIFLDFNDFQDLACADAEIFGFQ